MTNAIEVTNLTKYYGKFMAVDHIDFAVKEGEIFGFLGPNGAGKSTTQRMLTTLLTPTEGQILILGHDLAQDAYPAKRQIGLVPEESNVYTELTAWDNLMFTGRLYRMSKADRTARAQELLETFGLWEKRDVKAENFSKGMRRRLSIAMAIIHKPALLFLDEPTPGLDAQSARTIRGLIRQLSADGTTVFMTTHQIEEANQLCDRVAIINNGKIAAIDTPEQLKQTFQKVQSVEVAFSNAQEGIKEKLANLAEVNTLVKIGDKWRLYTEDPSTLLPQIMSLADTDGLRVVSLNTLAPSLEDVFLQITGQQIGVVQHKETPKRPGMRRGKGD
ncbi:MAG: ATP-binding cassette domain-containing protein [Chloroflexi bacterium]|nr:ATP-binding cassette domain-containing protein [Chloroflexota bacterium]